MGKGRDKHLIEERDRRLFERFYFWTEVKRLRYDDTITKLSTEEFFLSEGRVLQIIRQCIQNGMEVDGSTVSRPRFSGFRSRCRKPRKPLDGQLSLFPLPTQ